MRSHVPAHRLGNIPKRTTSAPASQRRKNTTTHGSSKYLISSSVSLNPVMMASSTLSTLDAPMMGLDTFEPTHASAIWAIDRWYFLDSSSTRSMMILSAAVSPWCHGKAFAARVRLVSTGWECGRPRSPAPMGPQGMMPIPWNSQYWSNSRSCVYHEISLEREK